MPNSKLWGALNWDDWVYGLLYGAIGGGSNSVYAAFGALVVDPRDFAFGSAKSFKLIGWVFVFSALMSMFLYLKQKPLPDRIETQEKTKIVSTDQHGGVVTVQKTVQTSAPVEIKASKDGEG